MIKKVLASITVLTLAVAVVVVFVALPYYLFRVGFWYGMGTIGFYIFAGVLIWATNEPKDEPPNRIPKTK